MSVKNIFAATLLTIASIVTLNIAHAVDPLLVVKPDKCVSLRKGQLCYQRINLSWTANINGRYCIMASDKPTPLRCWENSNTGKITYSLESTENIEFQLISPPKEINTNVTNSHGKAILSTATVTIAWVYNTKSRNRTTWRLF